ncbi:hypothetical protein CALCODRAFT_504900 [Calocera cornea HHB12733]|uniref:Uncharacterized protein n=1 Tax=Calocera cornea HHB12733 TaxID=1353952 RepID=A0A165C5T6_9BASI|nr:hypothetical protein CALCODRAFT_504900 [Calocera cornea HHB12733]
MRFSFTHLIALVLLAVLSSPALAAPTVPGIGRHRNPATVSSRQASPATVAARAAAPAPIAVELPDLELKRTELDGEFERRMEARMEGVLGAMSEAKARNEQKKHKRARMARFHP